jgi:hypothetical protein
MKFDTNLRLLFSAFFLILLASTFYPTNSNALEPSDTVNPKWPACTKSAAGIITPPDAEKNCELTPDEQKLTFLRIDLCTEKPTGPTVSVPIDRSKCTTFFRDDNGAEVSVKLGEGTAIGDAGDYSAVPHDTYTYGVATMSSLFKFTSSVTFSSEMTDVSGGGGSTTCVTREGTVSPVYGYSDNLTAAQANVSCTAGAVASEITVGLNVLTTETTTDDCVHLLNFRGTNGIVSAYLLESDDTLVTGVGATDTDQIKNGLTGCIHRSDNGVSKILGIMEFGTPMVIGPRTAGVEIKYNNTRGMTLNQGGGTDRVYFWDMAFFDFTMTAKTARARGSWR